MIGPRRWGKVGPRNKAKVSLLEVGCSSTAMNLGLPHANQDPFTSPESETCRA